MRLWYLALLLPLIGIVAAKNPGDINDVSSEGDAAAVIEKPPTSESSEEGLNSDEVNQKFEEFPESSPEELSNEAERQDSNEPVVPIESKTNTEIVGEDQETTGMQDVERKNGDQELEQTEEHPEIEDWSSEERDDAEIMAPEGNSGDKVAVPAATDVSKTSSDASAEQDERLDSEVGEKQNEEDQVEETEEQPEVEDWSSEESDDVENKPAVNEESEELTEEQPELSDEHADEEKVNQNEDEVAENTTEEGNVPEGGETEEAEDKSSEENNEEENENEKAENASTGNEKTSLSDGEQIAEVEEIEDTSSEEEKKDEQEGVEEPSKETHTSNESETAEETVNGEAQESREVAINDVDPPEKQPTDDFDVREKIVEHALKSFAELVQQKNGEVDDTVATSDTPVEEVPVEEQTHLTEADVTDGAEVSEVDSPRAMTHDDIRASIITEAEKAFKNIIQEEETIEVEEELRSEPKLAESEEKEITKLMSNALGEKEELVVETEEKAEEDEIIKNLTRLRRATKEHSPVELPMETKDETGKNETLPAAIEKDAPRVETKRQEMAKAKFTDGLGWIHYPWKTYPILKKRFHYDRQCGCEVMWIKRVYTRPRPKSKLLLVHSVALSPRCLPTRSKSHSVHSVKRPRKAPKPCKRRTTGSKGHRTVSRRLAELSWSNHLAKTKSAAREGRLTYEKRHKNISRRRRCNKKNKH